jgi:hypothetical protein
MADNPPSLGSLGGTTTGPPSDATRKVYNNATKNFSASTVSG